MSAMRKDVREFIRRLEAAGLTVEAKPGHYHVFRDGKPLSEGERPARDDPFLSKHDALAPNRDPGSAQTRDRRLARQVARHDELDQLRPGPSEEDPPPVEHQRR